MLLSSKLKGQNYILEITLGHDKLFLYWSHYIDTPIHIVFFLIYIIRWIWIEAILKRKLIINLMDFPGTLFYIFYFSLFVQFTLT